MEPFLGIAGYGPHHVEGDAPLTDDERARLDDLIGRELVGSWAVWDSAEDEWFTDGPVVLAFDGAPPLELAAFKTHLCVSWDSIDVSAGIDWGDLTLEWRRDALDGLNALRGRAVTGVALSEDDGELDAVTLTAGDVEAELFNAFDELALRPAGRPPTSHERRSGQPWDVSYRAGPAPWDIERPQPAIVRLGEDAFSGAVLDAGCGTGENALHVAALGLPVVGVDVAETAIAIARETATRRGLDARFEVADALHLDRLGRQFDTVLDCGLFHTFDGAERRAYVAGLASVTRRGGRVYVLCFSEAGAGRPGPHPVSETELREAFATGWSVVSIAPERIETRFAVDGAPGWLATIVRS